MLVLFETAAGFAIFKLLDEKKLAKSEDLFKDFESIEKANKIVQLQKFKKFADSAEALQASVAINEGKMCKPLKKLLKKIFVDDVQDKLMVWDPKLGSSIKEKLGLEIVSSGVVGELMRCIKTQVESLIPELGEKELSAMSLGLGHNLSRYKLKFSPDKVDTMIVQAVNLLDDIDKELNNYVMRAREWYGWHFPELGKIVSDNTQYIKTVMALGMKEKAQKTDFSAILSEELEERVKVAAEISMGTEIAEEDIENILCLCDQISELTEYRTQLFDYLKNRMHAIAPNLNILVGELVGARLIAKAGSLLNLAKHPASTIQILGAEKALFSALKQRKATPKFGLMYHAQLVTNASTANKGKMSRMLAAKAALATRYDALGEDTNTDMGIEHRAKLASRLRFLESGKISGISGQGRAKARNERYIGESQGYGYEYDQDNKMEVGGKRKFDDDLQVRSSKKLKVEMEGGEVKAEPVQEEEENNITPAKKKKKKKDKEADTSVAEEEETMAVDTPSSGKKKKKKSKDVDVSITEEVKEEAVEETSSSKKKKKKKKESD